MARFAIIGIIALMLAVARPTANAQQQPAAAPPQPGLYAGQAYGWGMRITIATISPDGTVSGTYQGQGQRSPQDVLFWNNPSNFITRRGEAGLPEFGAPTGNRWSMIRGCGHDLCLRFHHKSPYGSGPESYVDVQLLHQ